MSGAGRSSGRALSTAGATTSRASARAQRPQIPSETMVMTSRFSTPNNPVSVARDTPAATTARMPPVAIRPNRRRAWRASKTWLAIIQNWMMVRVEAVSHHMKSAASRMMSLRWPRTSTSHRHRPTSANRKVEPWTTRASG